jgi:muramoyltetrapeptide carboxypeptidase
MNKPINPPLLKKGAKVCIISTARKVKLEEIVTAQKVLESWGLEVAFGKNLFAEQNQYAGSDEQRCEDLQEALNNTSLGAILFARGGYGTVRIIDSIDFSLFLNHPKWLLGYSDITVIHSHLQQHTNITSMHAPMAFNFQTMPDSVLQNYQRVLFSGMQEFNWEAQKMNRAGETSGILVGGNLSILYSLLGSVSDLNTKGKILFLEDLDEYLYHLDRMMWTLKRSGKLKHLAGLVVGGMSDMKDNTVPFGKSPEEIILDAVKEYDYPVCFGFPAGHIADNYPLILGQEVNLSVGNTVRLISQNQHGSA